MNPIELGRAGWPRPQDGPRAPPSGDKGASLGGRWAGGPGARPQPGWPSPPRPESPPFVHCQSPADLCVLALRSGPITALGFLAPPCPLAVKTLVMLGSPSSVLDGRFQIRDLSRKTKTWACTSPHTCGPAEGKAVKRRHHLPANNNLRVWRLTNYSAPNLPKPRRPAT